jgi:hypothetical protein
MEDFRNFLTKEKKEKKNNFWEITRKVLGFKAIFKN